MLFWLCFLVFSASIVFGGATHSGFLGDVAVQLLAIPLLVCALWPALSVQDPNRGSARLAAALCCIAAAGVCLQLLPLPFDWARAGRFFYSGPLAQGSGLDRTSSTALSLTPQATWAAAVSLIVPLAVFSAVIQLKLKERLGLGMVLLASGAAALVLGFLQVANGPASPLRFYGITNATEAVGFFANRNHFAAHLYLSLLFTGVWFAITASKRSDRAGTAARRNFPFAGAAVFLVSALAGLALAKSRAGILLSMIALGGLFALILTQGSDDTADGGPLRFSTKRLASAVIVFGILFVAQFGLGGVLTRFQNDPVADLRVTLNETTWDAVAKAAPFGTGLGSFVPIYAAAEKQEDAFAGYANRAHNDLAEFLLETGLLGAGGMLAFLIWFARRSYRVWQPTRLHRDLPNLTLERTSTIAIALLLVHSLVDYPLRTAALSAMFAYFCGVLAVPAAARPASSRTVRRPAKPNAALPQTHPSSTGGRWGAEVDWPESWQKP